MSQKIIAECVATLQYGKTLGFQMASKECLHAWEQLKILVPQESIQWRYTKDSKFTLHDVSQIREALELSCMFHIQLKNLNEYEISWYLLEPFYINYPSLSSNVVKASLYAFQLLKLLVDREDTGDFHMLLQRLSLEDLKNSDIVFVVNLKQLLMSGNYRKALEIISKPPDEKFVHLCQLLIDSIRKSVADCLTNSLTEIPSSEAKSLLNLDSDNKLNMFIIKTNDRYRRENFICSSMETPSKSFLCHAEDMGTSPYFRWERCGDNIKFVAVNDTKKKCIPIDQVLEYVTGYIRELERIV
ncbi:uncharacterized protein LOC128883866 isoform X2 [Hylaeus volcanicus]|uniref:uncharacterized protein LOC128883866 isoform X2 n=1 Tax=Hylaeus volcanicus TaxID=313075 RepID=UPI0023B7DC4D|nr:uncharacterized protein LOC128883866 isoform X2 [Hylaeus volcanicus]